MTGHFLYLSYPYAFRIAIIKAGYYAGGNYYLLEADQFTSKNTVDVYRGLLFEGIWKDPLIKPNCKSCIKTCHNLTVYESCCDYEPMEGLVGCLI